MEVVIRSLCAVGSMSDTKFEGRELILGDLGSVMNKIAVKALMSQHNMQVRNTDESTSPIGLTIFIWCMILQQKATLFCQPYSRNKSLLIN